MEDQTGGLGPPLLLVALGLVDSVLRCSGSSSGGCCSPFPPPDVRAAREQMNLGGVSYPLQEAPVRPPSLYSAVSCSPSASFSGPAGGGGASPQPHSSYFSGLAGPQHPFYNRVSHCALTAPPPGRRSSAATGSASSARLSSAQLSGWSPWSVEWRGTVSRQLAVSSGSGPPVEEESFAVLFVFFVSFSLFLFCLLRLLSLVGCVSMVISLMFCPSPLSHISPTTFTSCHAHSWSPPTHLTSTHARLPKPASGTPRPCL